MSRSQKWREDVAHLRIAVLNLGHDPQKRVVDLTFQRGIGLKILNPIEPIFLLEIRKNSDDVSEYKVEELGYPVVVKPNSGGSSVATFICKDYSEVVHGVLEGLKVDKEVMIEEFIQGDEITVPILDGEVLPTLIIKPQKGGFFDYTSKYEDGGADEHIFAYEDVLQKEINLMASETYNALKCEVYARVDFIVRDGVPFILEINTLPGMTKNSLFPKSAKGIGLDYKGLLDRIIKISLKVRGNQI
jgi:D-alanine-D-alanine ligase